MKPKSCMPASQFFNVNVYGEIESKLLIYMYANIRIDTDADTYGLMYHSAGDSILHAYTLRREYESSKWKIFGIHPGL